MNVFCRAVLLRRMESPEAKAGRSIMMRARLAVRSDHSQNSGPVAASQRRIHCNTKPTTTTKFHVYSFEGHYPT